MKQLLALLISVGFIFASNTIVADAAGKKPYKSLALEAAGADKSKAAEANNDGVRHFRGGRHWSEAGEFFENALKLDPNLPEAHFNLALVHHKKGRHAKATEHFKKAAELAPNDPRIRNSEILKAHIK
ncbi:MAG: tetratricopeptide repeat protein [Nitrospinota bacterium]